MQLSNHVGMSFLRRWLLFFTAALPVLFYSTVLQAEQTADQGSVQLRNFIREVQQAQGLFTQQTVSAEGKAQAEQSGQFAFNRGAGQFRWQVDTPYEQLILADGEHLIQYDPDLSQATQRGLEDAVGNSPAAILFGSRRIDDGFELKDRQAADGLQWLRATPKGTEVGFQYVDMGFQDGLPARLIIMDGFGQRTTIELKEIKPGVELPTELFKFEAPEGVDVINLQP